ncbi:ChaN family lipoprotein [Sansalvadorimonas sp. 2012CJ34-2]|uniref:ChaN family lipoprotein n=1 Tax=Parendozoicomonas callyspongiae TaxID=2942213 RepID=A0ABT0PKG1_9GAMM|nr:ChaN family lipoprotein [Sansalvadorimonas sp. 2012CJ34-2]MCL6271761.1 ChaN family lipoprotein [Sansalvadorimonas sp. 2012CJ34-2]
MKARFLEKQKPVLSLEDLSSKLQTADYVVLGEAHDNPIHHDLQLAVLQSLHDKGWLKQITMEMMIPSQQAAADEMAAKGITNPDKIYELLEWNDGWDWAFYGPIVIWAVSEGIPLRAGNLSRDELKIIRAQPVRIGEVMLGKGGLNIHRERLRSAHCGNISKAMEERMLRVQVARDARMANSMMAIPTGSALLAGNWHARKDIGVPKYLESLKPEAVVIAVGFLEQPAMADLGSAEFFDIAWDTPGIQRQGYSDLCKPKSVK